MFYISIGIIVVLAVLLVLLVLAQNSKGGVNNQFGGGASSVMGVQKTSDILEKLTWGFIGGIILLSVVANKSIDKTQTTSKNVNIEAAAKQTIIDAPTTAPVEEAPATTPAQ